MTSVNVSVHYGDDLASALLTELPDTSQCVQFLQPLIDEIFVINVQHAAALQRPIAIKIISPEESRALNDKYRQKDKPTNILSFPYALPEGLPNELMAQFPLGDLAICHAVLCDEAKAQGKKLMHHYAHILVHGCLHLLGYDHIADEDAEQMEALEIKVLGDICIKNPYARDD